MLYNLIRLPPVALQPPATGCQSVRGRVVALVLTGREEAPGNEWTQTTRIYVVSVFVCACVCFQTYEVKKMACNRDRETSEEHLNVVDKTTHKVFNYSKKKFY